RGLPFWFSLAMHGKERYSNTIERGLELAQIAANKIRTHKNLELVREPSLSCVLFRTKGWTSQQYNNWTRENQKSGLALVTPTQWTKKDHVETVYRFCFINPTTTEDDIDIILETLN